MDCVIFIIETGFKSSVLNKIDGGMVMKRKSDLTFFQKVKRSRTLLLMCTPAVLFFFAFNYMPLPGIWVAFVKYNYRDGILEVNLWVSRILNFWRHPASFST